jgi:hypothetical protein
MRPERSLELAPVDRRHVWTVVVATTAGIVTTLRHIITTSVQPAATQPL